MSNEVVKRIEKLEDMMGVLLQEIREIKSQTQAIEEKTREPIDEALLGPNDYEPNPWAKYTALKLMKPEVNQQEIEESTKSFRPTISALISSEQPLTAEEVAEKTGRARNTESGYLNKLVRADLVVKTEAEGKKYFSIKDRAFIEKYFPSDGN